MVDIVSVIAESLTGRRIAITGATGFVGTALVERLIRAVPGCELVLVIRPGRRTTAAQRAQKEIIHNDAFDYLRAELGDGFDEEIAGRISTIAGDVGTDGLGLDATDRAVFASCDIVIHSAAAVSFDSPLDSAVEINLLGPTRVAELCHDLGVTPHLVSVSTCYVAGNRRGNAPEQLVSEGPFDIGLSWKAEVAAARRLKGDTEALSRQPVHLAEFRRNARHEIGAAGAPALASKTEQLRTRWVKDQLVAAGRARAASVGWPDAYAFTKALGEQALTESKGDVPVSIVRPSIIESALGRAAAGMDPRVPHGGAGDHLLRPWVAEGVPWHAGGHGRRDPRRHGGRRDHRRRRGRARARASDHPGRVRWHQPAQVPHARRQRQRLLHRAPAVRQRGPADRRSRVELPWARPRASAADTRQVGDHTRREGDAVAPVARQAGRVRGDARAEAARGRAGPRVRRAVRPLHRVRGDLSGRQPALAVGRRSTTSTRRSSSSIPRVVDWPTYIHEIHLPSIVDHARVKSTPGKSRSTDRMVRLRKQVLDPKRHVAAFDLENTLIDRTSSRATRGSRPAG